MTARIASFFILATLSTAAWCAQPSSEAESVQPYIESLKKKHDIQTPPPEAPLPPASEAVAAPKPEVSDDPNVVQPHIQKILGAHPPSEEEPVAAPSQLSHPGAEVQPHLEAIKARKELAPKPKGKVNQAAGFSVVASNNFNITSTKVQANNFNDVYQPSNKYAPSADLFYAYELLRDPYAGAVSAMAHLGVITIAGKGLFTKTGAQSQDTTFKFYAVPITLGGEYRFLQLHYLQPYVQLGAVGIPFFETRNDDHPSRRGISRGYNVTGGAALNLDWISRSDAWAQYDDASVFHTYLVGQMEFLRPISGPVSFNYTALYLGLMFEF